MEKYKVLEFIGAERGVLGKYAHPVGGRWGGSDIPLLMTKDTTFDKLKQLWPWLDFDKVKLVTKELVDFSK